MQGKLHKTSAGKGSQEATLLRRFTFCLPCYRDCIRRGKMDLNFQYAHHAHDESETKSNVSPNEAVIAFDQFDWEGEVEKSNELQKCSPTLSVLINGTEEMVWPVKSVWHCKSKCSII
jgi:hypothetical protein